MKYDFPIILKDDSSKIKHQKILEIIRAWDRKPLYSSIGVQRNSQSKINSVAKVDLEYHLEYNLRERPDRALFLDGACIYVGNLSEKEIEEFENSYRTNPHIPTQVSFIYE